MTDDFKQIKRSKASQKDRKSFGGEWMEKTYTGAAIKAVGQGMGSAAAFMKGDDAPQSEKSTKGDREKPSTPMMYGANAEELYRRRPWKTKGGKDDEK